MKSTLVLFQWAVSWLVRLLTLTPWSTSTEREYWQLQKRYGL